MANVVITGSTKGIGRGLATEFARLGHNVMIAGRSQQAIDEAIANIGSQPGKVSGRPCEVSQKEQVQALWDAAAEEFGSIDIWINNAGLARTVWPILETPDEEIQAMVTTNMFGTIFGSKVAVSGMKAQGHGKLFNMLGGGSDGEFFPGIGIYGTTKRGLNYFTDALIKENKDTPLVIGKIRPGMVITEAVVREAKADLENFNKNRKTMNNLCDTVDTVSPYLVEQILKTEKSGTKIRWLTGGKIAKRMMLSRFRNQPDKFEAFGL
ncbi:MAG: chitin-binding protein [Spongiibacteraceae bacterium]|jgi:NAD(P)-dependent dehydrogenase (short-subunit alcohol dehydrogenase family)|nr:chitin-binding protein [Spongiibacteraceae bacterium]